MASLIEDKLLSLFVSSVAYACFGDDHRLLEVCLVVIGDKPKEMA